MSEDRNGLGFGLLALVAIVCCVGVPLIAALRVGVGVAAWAGGITLAVLVLIAVVALLFARARRHRSHRPSTSIPGAR